MLKVKVFLPTGAMSPKKVCKKYEEIMNQWFSENPNINFKEALEGKFGFYLFYEE